MRPWSLTDSERVTIRSLISRRIVGRCPASDREFLEELRDKIDAFDSAKTERSDTPTITDPDDFDFCSNCGKHPDYCDCPPPMGTQ